MKFFFRSDVQTITVPISENRTHVHTPRGIPEVEGPNFVECDDAYCIEALKNYGGVNNPNLVPLTYDEAIVQDREDRANDRLNMRLAEELAKTGATVMRERIQSGERTLGLPDGPMPRAVSMGQGA